MAPTSGRGRCDRDHRVRAKRRGWARQICEPQPHSILPHSPAAMERPRSAAGNARRAGYEYDKIPEFYSSQLDYMQGTLDEIKNEVQKSNKKRLAAPIINAAGQVTGATIRATGEMGAATINAAARAAEAASKVTTAKIGAVGQVASSAISAGGNIATQYLKSNEQVSAPAPTPKLKPKKKKI